MIRKLRRKFILTNMALVSLVLLIVFCVLIWSNYQQLRAQNYAAMRLALEWDGAEGPPRFEFGPPPDETEGGDASDGDSGGRLASLFPAFSVTLDENGQVESIQAGSNVDVSDALVEQAVEQVLASGQTEGDLSSLRLRFLAEERSGVLHIAFSDLGWEWQNLSALILTSLLIGLGALAGFFLISLFLARLAVRPVERAWEQQRQFVADASHELKTPLTVILANTGIVLSHPEDTARAQSKWLSYTREEAQRMKGLVEDLLFLAKSDAQRASRARLPVDLSGLVTGCLLPFEPVVFEAGVALESTLSPGLTVTGDEGQLRRLVLILLDNAVKYTPRGGAVTVALVRVQERVRLTVHNTGEAIPPEHLEHLFERFYRSDSARTRQAGGYGLGLAIAKSIAEGHRGKISVSSGAGGTTFTLLLPTAK